jgi:hypothetical protein
MYQNAPLLGAFRLTDIAITDRVSGGPASAAQPSLPGVGTILGLGWRGQDSHNRAQLCALAWFAEYHRARSILHRDRPGPATGIRDRTTRYPAFRRDAP